MYLKFQFLYMFLLQRCISKRCIKKFKTKKIHFSHTASFSPSKSPTVQGKPG